MGNFPPGILSYITITHIVYINYQVGQTRATSTPATYKQLIARQSTPPLKPNC